MQVIASHVQVYACKVQESVSYFKSYKNNCNPQKIFSVFFPCVIRISSCYTVVWKDKLDLRIVQGIWLGPWSKVPIEKLEFIEK